MLATQQVEAIAIAISAALGGGGGEAKNSPPETADQLALGLASFMKGR